MSLDDDMRDIRYDLIYPLPIFVFTLRYLAKYVTARHLKFMNLDSKISAPKITALNHYHYWIGFFT